VDQDNSGSLDHAEIREVFTLMGLVFDDEQFLEAWKEIDTDGSGQVDISEFR